MLPTWPWCGGVVSSSTGSGPVCGSGWWPTPLPIPPHGMLSTNTTSTASSTGNPCSTPHSTHHHHCCRRHCPRSPAKKTWRRCGAEVGRIVPGAGHPTAARAGMTRVASPSWTQCVTVMPSVTVLSQTAVQTSGTTACVWAWYRRSSYTHYHFQNWETHWPRTLGHRTWWGQLKVSTFCFMYLNLNQNIPRM